MAGVGGDHRRRRRAAFAEAGGVLMVDGGRAGEAHDASLLVPRDTEVLPPDEVAADGVAPGHVLPAGAVGVELVEEVELAVVEQSPFGSLIQPRGGAQWKSGRSCRVADPSASPSAASGNSSLCRSCSS